MQKHYLLMLFAFTSLLLMIFSVTLYRQSAVVEGHDLWVQHSYEVLRKNRRLYTHVLDVETGQRGYLLTGTTSFLEPYERALTQLGGELDSLQYDTRDMPAQQENIRQLRGRVHVLLNLLDEQIRAYRKRGIRALNKKNLADARAAMDEVRLALDKITTQELTLLRHNAALSRLEQRNYIVILFAGSALAVLGLLLANALILTLLHRNRGVEERMRAFEERLRLILEGVNDGIYDHDLVTDLTVFSPSYKQLLGYGPEALNGERSIFYGFIHPEDVEELRAHASRYLNRETPTYQHIFRMRHEDGGWRWILSRGIGQWDKSGKATRLVGTHSDISEQKNREQELFQLNQELESFAYIASHDLRSPLVNLKGFAGEIKYALDESVEALQPLLETLPTEKRRRIEHNLLKDIPDSLGFIRSAVEKMDGLTTAILDMSRIGKRIYRVETVVMETVIRRCLDSLAYEIGHRGIGVEVSPLPDIRSDPVAVEQIFGNILDNAVKYLSADRPGRIHIESRSFANGHEFHVHDNGRGIHPQDSGKVFDIFRRAGNVGDVRGVGMGMAYVKATVRKIGGRIWFVSTPNEGTVFSVFLPMQPPSTADAPIVPAAISPLQAAAPFGTRIPNTSTEVP